MTNLAEVIQQFAGPAGRFQRVVIGFSGGLDSTALLCAAAHAQLPQTLLAVHVNHGLSPHADQWQAHCERLCQKLGVSLTCVRVQVEVQGQGLEQAARQARLRALEAQLLAGDLLLTAHHQQDQAETLLLRLARGAGLEGLAAIRPLRRMGPATLGRPFLTLDKALLRQYLQAQQISWVEDESNAEQRFDRNYLRHSVLPGLLSRWPGFIKSSARCAELLAESGDLLLRYAQADLASLERRPERLGESVLWRPLLAFDAPRRHHVLRCWLQSLGYRAPPRRRLQEAEALLRSAADREPQLHCGDCLLRRYQDRLYCLPAAVTLSAAGPGELCWDMQQPLMLKHGFSLRAEPASSGLRADRVYQVRFREGPLRAQPYGRPHSQTLKKLLQERALEPWLRPHVPLLFAGDQLVAVGDLWVEQAAWVEGGGPAVQLVWRQASALPAD